MLYSMTQLPYNTTLGCLDFAPETLGHVDIVQVL